jgi:TonB family protein
MSTSTTQLTQTGLSMGIMPQRSRPDPEAWKKFMGPKPVAARLAMLPDRKLSRSALATSTLFQVLVAAVLVSLPMFFPQKLATKIIYEVTPIAQLQTEVLLPPKPPVTRVKVQPVAVEQPQPEEKPEPPQRVPRLIAPRNLVPPKIKPVEVKNTEVPQVSQALTEAKFEAAPDEPARPREPVKTGLITTGSAAPATVSAPVSKVQTGGFGDPEGLPGDSNPNKKANIGHFGSPALPPGPGYGNGTGGATGIRGTVASAGFGNGVAIPPAGSSAPRGEVKSGGFAAATVDSEVPKAKPTENTAAVQPVVILEKPNPIYTEEARKLGIEGEVLVEVVFPASGPVRVVRVAKGLGHGLDEAAERAAEQIRFKPALQSGQPVDFPATVHIVFQVAF